MSRTNSPYAGRFTHHALNRRTVAEIQKESIKRGKRNVISRLFRAGDKKTIATWTLGLDRILHILNVRSVTSV